MQQVAYLGLGSNLGDREANLRQAISLLVDGGLRLVTESSVYETDPVDFLDQPKFLNQVIAVTAPNLEPFALMKLCLEIEAELGRVRTVPRGARTLDIDLLLFGDEVINGESVGVELTLPHPQMHLRRFVLQPLAEIAPKIIHPILQKTSEQLLAAVADHSSARMFRKSLKP